MSEAQTNPQPTEPSPIPAAPPVGLRMCCACPETKKLRDDCVILNGEESCQEAIENHKKCLRSLGFKI